MREQSAAAAGAMLRLLDSGAYAWLVAIEARAGEAFYLTSSRDPIEHAGRTWQPYPVAVDILRDDGEGNLPTTTVTLSNAAKVAMPYLEARGWDQRDVTIELLDLRNPATPLLRARFAILAATATWDRVTLKLGQPNFFDRQYPARRYLRADGFPGIRRNRN